MLYVMADFARSEGSEDKTPRKRQWKKYLPALAPIGLGIAGGIGGHVS